MYLAIAGSIFCVVAIASFVAVYRDPINPEFRGKILFQSTAGVWDFGSDLFYIGTTPFISTDLLWFAIATMVAPSIIFVIIRTSATERMYR